MRGDAEVSHPRGLWAGLQPRVSPAAESVPCSRECPLQASASAAAAGMEVPEGFDEAEFVEAAREQAPPPARPHSSSL